MSNKTAAMILNEICAKNGTRPMYTDTEKRLPSSPHVPVFYSTCTIANLLGKNYEATHSGPTKKAAKQNVSELIIRDHLKISLADDETAKILLATPVDVTAVEEGAAAAPENVLIPHDSELLQARALQGNPIQDLKVYAEEKNLLEPEFEEEDMMGPSHKPTLVVWCSVGTVREKGTSNKKKTSKRIAALKVLAALRELDDAAGLSAVQNPAPETLSPERIDRIFEIVKKNREEQLAALGREPGFTLSRKACSFSNNARECRAHFHNLQHDFDRIAIGPLLQELLEATENMSEIGNSPVKMRAFIRAWIEQRQSEMGSVVAVFNGLRKELKFTYMALEREVPVLKKRSRVKQRQERDHTDHLYDFKSMALEHVKDGDESRKSMLQDKRVYMTVIETDLKDLRRMPKCAGFGADYKESFSNAALEIIIGLMMMFRSTTSTAME